LHPCAPKTQGVSNMNHWSAECAKCCIRKINHKAVSMFCTQCYLSRKKLLTNMRVFEHEIIDDEKHLDKCYSPFQRLYNDGYLTLVHPKYAALGLKILNTIGDVANEETTKEKGNDMAKEAEKSVLENKELARVFLEISKDTSNLTEKQKMKVFNKMVDKTTNARVGDALQQHKSNTTSRGAKSENSVAFRTNLKAISSWNKKKAPVVAATLEERYGEVASTTNKTGA
jgi:hypothetical protein